MYKQGFEEAEKLKIKLPTFVGLWGKQGEFQKNIYFCFIDYTKAFDCVDHNKLWKILRDGIKNPPAMWETWVRSPGWEDRLEKGKATHYSILAWRIPSDSSQWGRKHN